MEALFAIGTFMFTSMWVVLFHSLRHAVRGTPYWYEDATEASHDHATEAPHDHATEQNPLNRTRSASEHKKKIVHTKRKAFMGQSRDGEVTMNRTRSATEHKIKIVHTKRKAVMNQSKDGEATTMLYVKGCDGEFENETTLKRRFEKIGPVKYVKVRRRAVSEGGNWAIVEMANLEAARKILDNPEDEILARFKVEYFSEEVASHSTGAMERMNEAFDRETHVEVSFHQKYSERTGVTEVGALSHEDAHHGALAELSSCFGLGVDKDGHPWRHKISKDVFRSISRWRIVAVSISMVSLLATALSFHAIFEVFMDDFEVDLDLTLDSLAPSIVLFAHEGCISKREMQVHAMLLLGLWVPACGLASLVWPAWLLSLQLGAVSSVG